VSFVLLLIKYYGATNTEIVKSLRKVLSIALSFAIYPKPVNSRYLGGMVATCASLVLSYRLKRRKVRSCRRAQAAFSWLTAPRSQLAAISPAPASAAV
jgi:adenosine 3'-phospho 5'-phosphosulfate transporter B3